MYTMYMYTIHIILAARCAVLARKGIAMLALHAPEELPKYRSEAIQAVDIVLLVAVCM